MDTTVVEAIKSALRYVLVAAGTYAAAKGWIGAGQVETLVGSAVAIIGAAWGVYDSRRKVL